MTAEEFWHKYMKENILDIFEDTCDFFSENLPKGFIDKYDVGEVILETRGHQETAKNFDNVIKFTEIIQNYQPKLYKEYFQYFDDFLIYYFCFYQDKQKVNKALTRFIANPLHDYDIYFLVFKKLLFYKHSELIEQAISKNFVKISKSDDLMGNAAYDLAIVKFYNSMQEIFLGQEESIDKKAFLSKLSKYNFDFGDDFLSTAEIGLLKPQFDADKIKDLFKKEKKKTIVILQWYFQRYMYEKGFEFYLSGSIWDKMLVYCRDNNSSGKIAESYFKIQTALFEKYLARFTADMFLDNLSEMIAILWGSVYIFDFLHKAKIISEENFQDFLETSRQLKGNVIGQFTSDLWNSNFVHIWEKPDCISEIEFEEENNIFKKSISLKKQKFSILRSSISEELSKIGELSHYIIKGGEDDSKIKRTSLLDDFFNKNQKSEEVKKQSVTEKPINVEKKVEIKVGRNEPCPCGSGKKYKKCCG